MFLLNPDSQLNTKSDVYARNEENMLDWEGNMTEEKEQVKILLSKVNNNFMIVASNEISTL